MKRFAIGILLALGVAGAAFAQSPVATQPQGKPTLTNGSSTIAVTNTFQSVFAQANGRLGCTIQNHAANSQWVFFGPIASATKAKSVLLTQGQGVSCGIGGISLTDQVSITGTAGDEFFAALQ